VREGAAALYCWILEILYCDPKGRRALLRTPSTEGRSVCLCGAPSKSKGPKGGVGGGHLEGAAVLFSVQQRLLRLAPLVVLGAGCVQGLLSTRKVDIRLPGKGDSNSHGARPVHQKHRWTRTSRLSIKNSLPLLSWVSKGGSPANPGLGAA